MSDDPPLLDQFRAGGSELDAAGRARLRERMLQTIEADDPTIRARLGEAPAARGSAASTLVSPGPASTDPTVLPIVTGGAPRVVADYVAAGRGSRSSRRSTRVVAFAAAAALLLVALAAGVLSRDGGEGDAPTMSDLAAAIEALPATDLGDGFVHQQVLYIQDTAEGWTSRTQEHWVDAEGNARQRIVGRVRSRGTPPTTTVEGPSETADYQAPDGALFTGYSYDQLMSLPTEPQPLLTTFAEEHDRRGVEGAVTSIGQILAYPASPPALRAAAVRALGSLGAQDLGEVVGPRGVGGLGFVVPGEDDEEFVVILDPETASTRTVIRYAYGRQGSLADESTTSFVTVYLVSDIQPNMGSTGTTAS